jgi:hypothetical protein
MSTCENCGKPLVQPKLGRPQTRFCARDCKEAKRAEEQKAERLRARGGRVCEQCGGPIPATRNARARFCTDACALKWHNAQLAQAKHEAAMATRAARPPCAFCQGPIPADLRVGAIYCRKACRVAANLLSWRERSPGYMRRYLYGVTPEEFAAKLAEQDYRCAICRSPDWPSPGPNNNGRPHTEHDPATGRFRGITCGHCNLGMGHFKHDPALLRAAAGYLEAATAA